jgi:hypothetical protein
MVFDQIDIRGSEPEHRGQGVAAAQKPQILDPLDRAADVTVRPDHGFSAFR